MRFGVQRQQTLLVTTELVIWSCANAFIFTNQSELDYGIAYVHVSRGGGIELLVTRTALLANTFILLLFIKAAALVFVDPLYIYFLIVLLKLSSCLRAINTFHVDQHCSEVCSTNIISHFKPLN
jgi:hypothetical protein